MIVENGVQIAASDIVIVEPIDEDLGRPGISNGNIASLGDSGDLLFG